MSVQTNNIIKRAALALAGGLAGIVVMAATPVAASAFERANSGFVDQNHRLHQANSLNDYDANRFSRAGSRNSGKAIAITVSSRGSDFDRNRRRDNRNNFDNRNRRTGYYDNSRRSKRVKRSRIIKRDVFRTRFNARIVLTEEIIRGRRGKRLLCTVSVRGREAGYVPRRRINRIANRHCSRAARINIIA